MTRRTCILGLALAMATLTLGCGAGGANHKRAKPALTGDSTPQKTFARYNESVLKGDLRTAYDLTSSASRARNSYEQFCRDYQENKAIWDVRLKGAMLSVVSIDDDGLNASGKVIFGDGLSGVVDFVREEGIWRENRFYPINIPGR
ncbi:MAG: hypothetical protein HYY93_15725 [Planctomycetes bacterium]|nr:hypothetical protein [Planctomycetota bacterium]